MKNQAPTTGGKVLETEVTFSRKRLDGVVVTYMTYRAKRSLVAKTQSGGRPWTFTLPGHFSMVTDIKSTSLRTRAACAARFKSDVDFMLDGNDLYPAPIKLQGMCNAPGAF